jgi:hypothetical protein
VTASPRGITVFGDDRSIVGPGRVFVVEAKYGSGRHDASPLVGPLDRPRDQLLRQYHSIREPRSDRVAYIESPERAIRECRLVQAFVVDARRPTQARRDYEESKAVLPPHACLRIRTWQAK